MNRPLTLIGGIGLGTGLMYLLDPNAGRRRRAVMRDKAAGMRDKAVDAWHTTGDAVSTTSHDVRDRARDWASGARRVFRRGGGESRVSQWSGSRRAQWPAAWRVFAGAMGGALAYYGLKRRGPVGAAASAAGFSMLARSTTNRQVKNLFGLVRRAA